MRAKMIVSKRKPARKALLLHMAVWCCGMAASTNAFTTNSIGLKLVPIPTGEYRMGQSNETNYREERPIHPVRISSKIEMGATEITVGQWKTVMGKNPPAMGLDMSDTSVPVFGITWFEASAFCAKLSAKEGKVYRLPTEAEWEYACRAGTKTPFSVGNTISSNQAACGADTAARRSSYSALPQTPLKNPKPVGSFPANTWGLYDMHGNAQEWVWDNFSGELYSKSIGAGETLLVDRPDWS